VTARAVDSSQIPERARASSALRRLLRDPLGALGLALVLLLACSAILADAIALYSPVQLDIRNRLSPPTAQHWLGTDNLGRDTMSRVLYGGRVALWVSLVTVSLSVAIGMVLGMIAGYGPRWLDNTLMTVFDAVRSFPTIMFALAVVTILGPSLNTVIFIVVVSSIPIYGRVVRTQTLSMKVNEFILAERSLGAGPMRVLFHHILPNVIGPVLILASMEVPVVITIEAGLSFLGLGVRPPTPSWGSILNDGYAFIRETPWLILAGGLPIIITTLGFTFLGEALRDIFDPRLQRD
jgi:peptide/nickel transport system permease protein